MVLSSARRLVLVVASQCESMPYLPQLSDRAQALHEVLRDPHLGACRAALTGERSLLLGSRSKDLNDIDIGNAVKDAVKTAGREGAQLLLASVFH